MTQGTVGGWPCSLQRSGLSTLHLTLPHLLSGLFSLAVGPVQPGCWRRLSLAAGASRVSFAGPLDFQARTDQQDRPDRIDPALSIEPTENTEAREPAEPTDRIEPAEPIDKIDPLDPMLKIEPEEPIESNEPSRPRMGTFWHRQCRLLRLAG